MEILYQNNQLFIQNINEVRIIKFLDTQLNIIFAHTLKKLK